MNVANPLSTKIATVARAFQILERPQLLKYWKRLHLPCESTGGSRPPEGAPIQSLDINFETGPKSGGRRAGRRAMIPKLLYYSEVVGHL